MNTFEDEVLMEILGDDISERTMVYISTDEIYEHKDNPRKKLGDLTELTESIRKNGVWQNLVVIRGHFLTEAQKKQLNALSASNSLDDEEALKSGFAESGYTVIMGHRRLASAKKAGLKEVPCVVVEMTYEEQLKAMLCENMQRNDLSLYEQAKGFEQLKLCGMSVESISEETGFSESTVRSRLKVAKLPENEFRKSCEEKSITISDYLKISEFNQESEQKQLLNSVGTVNFNNDLKTLRCEAEFKADFQAWLDFLKSNGTEILENPKPNTDKYKRYKFKRRISRYCHDKDAIAELGSEQLYYFVELDTIWIWTRLNSEEYQKLKEKEDVDQKNNARNQELSNALNEMTNRHYALRKEFIESLNIAAEQKDIIRQYFFEAFIMTSIKPGLLYFNVEEAVKNLMASLGDKELAGQWREYDANTLRFKVGSLAKKEGLENAMLRFVFILLDSNKHSYFNFAWRSVGTENVFSYCENHILDFLYSILKALGYSLSKEENDARNGVIPAFIDELINKLDDE